MPRPISCTVSIAALRHNFSLAKTHALQSGHTGAWAVVKAAAYGHLLSNALAGFEQADGLAMLDFSDALYCRQQGWNKPILMLEGAFSPADVDQAIDLQLDLVVHNQEQVNWLKLKCKPLDQTAKAGAGLRLFLKVNTGMNRLGFAPPLAKQRFVELNHLARAVEWVTHFANADAEPTALKSHHLVTVEQQRTVFAAVTGAANLGSVANSAATLTSIEAVGWARPGVMLYGGSPFATKSAQQCGLRAAMALDSEIIAVQELSVGASVGYGSTFTATQPMRIGVVACGYADGYPRHAPTGTPVWVAGKRSRVVGRVSMDMLTIELPNASMTVGAPVQLWGAHMPIDEVATAAGTISYELMCAVAPRVARRTMQTFL